MATSTTTLPTTMDEIAEVALATFANLPDSVTEVHVMSASGNEIAMTRNSVKAWAK